MTKTLQPPSAPLSALDDPAQVLDSLATELRALQRRRKAAVKHKAEVLKQLSLAEIDEREARQLEATVKLRIYNLMGIKPPADDAVSPVDWRTLSWDNVWCPRCHHCFVPSKPGGQRG